MDDIFSQNTNKTHWDSYHIPVEHHRPPFHLKEIGMQPLNQCTGLFGTREPIQISGGGDKMLVSSYSIYSPYDLWHKKMSNCHKAVKKKCQTREPVLAPEDFLHLRHLMCCFVVIQYPQSDATHLKMFFLRSMMLSVPFLL